MLSTLAIHALGLDDLDRFVAYLAVHMAENGRGDTPLFQPQPRTAPWPAAEKRRKLARAWATPVGDSGWGRAWAAFDTAGEAGEIAGHADLRARPERCAEHRALLGVGVARAWRGQGLSRRLVEHALAWAERETALVWIDLNYLSGNAPARALYARLGFRQVATVEDMFRIDGEPVADVFMTLKIRA